MILLEEPNLCVQQAIQSAIESYKENQKGENIEVTVADFDGSTFHISTPESKTQLQISVHVRGFEKIKEFGAIKMAEKKYGALVKAATEPGFDLTVVINLEALPEKIETVINEISMAKHYFLCQPFIKLLEDMDAGAAPPVKPIEIPYRENESMFIKPEGDQMQVFFSILFSDADDVVFAKVFLQEFVDARRNVKSAPAVRYSNKEAPDELKGIVKEGDNIGFVTFVLFKSHIDKKNRDHSIGMIVKFRNYLHYHIKCSKAYMHTRMRSRVEAMLLVLNRAKPEPPKDKKEKKTITGRTFKR